MKAQTTQVQQIKAQLNSLATVAPTLIPAKIEEIERAVEKSETLRMFKKGRSDG